MKVQDNTTIVLISKSETSAMPEITHSTRKTRKNFFLDPQSMQKLAHLAAQGKVSEAEVVRQLLMQADQLSHGDTAREVELLEKVRAELVSARHALLEAEQAVSGTRAALRSQDHRQAIRREVKTWSAANKTEAEAVFQRLAGEP